ncbi:MAG: fructosamine kinase family protein [Cyanobacteria bacterium J06597_1]
MEREAWDEIASRMSETLGASFAIGNLRSMGGGAANTSHRIDGTVNGEQRSFFAKLGSLAESERFRTEALSLKAMHDTNTIRVPEPICWGSLDGSTYLVMDFLQLGGAPAGGPEKLGEQLAAMHRHTSDRFGWELSNTIGASPQQNGWSSNWIEFFQDKRLGFQLRLARRNGHSGRWMDDAERVIDRLPTFFDGYDPEPSILHGDLWSGNYGYDRQGNPVIFDPALYYGDREADLAMTELFGGFPAQFYRSYDTAFPLDPGYSRRKILYNLYHLLNHLNIFGTGYMGQVQRSIQQLLS